MPLDIAGCGDLSSDNDGQNYETLKCSACNLDDLAYAMSRREMGKVDGCGYHARGPGPGCAERYSESKQAPRA